VRHVVPALLRLFMTVRQSVRVVLAASHFCFECFFGISEYSIFEKEFLESHKHSTFFQALRLLASVVNLLEAFIKSNLKDVGNVLVH